MFSMNVNFRSAKEVVPSNVAWYQTLLQIVQLIMPRLCQQVLAMSFISDFNLFSAEHVEELGKKLTTPGRNTECLHRRRTEKRIAVQPRKWICRSREMSSHDGEEVVAITGPSEKVSWYLEGNAPNANKDIGREEVLLESGHYKVS